jgi:hypothetical protein
MGVYAYHYNAEFVFDGCLECQEDPLNLGSFLIPAQCTPVKPPAVQGLKVPVYTPTEWVSKNGSNFIDGTWELVVDYRSQLFWDKDTKEAKRVAELGEEPDKNWVSLKPGPYDIWNPKKKAWELSGDLQVEGKKKELLYWNRVKFGLLKDIRFAQETGMFMIVDDLKVKLEEVEIKIKNYGNLG